MTWNSACSIASDDESSRHSFLSDCDSEFDLRPPPRYPAEKRSYSTSNKQTINRIEPPLTRSRAKALEKSLTPVQLSPPPPSSASSSSQKRQSTVRRSVDVFTGMASALTNNLNTTSILFPKQESTNERISTAPLDGVNILADRFESCSLDEGRLNKNCLWPSRETNSHYQRPIPSSFSANMFDTNSFSPLNHSPLFRQQQAQLWSRFRYAASTLRDNLWTEQTDSSFQQVPSNIFTSNHNYLLNVNHHPTMLIPPQTVPTRLLTISNRVQPTEEPSSSLFRQRKITSTTEPIPSTHKTDDAPLRQTFSSKLFFTLTIFIIGLTLGYLLTNTLPPSLALKLCVKYFQYLCLYVQATLNYLTAS